MPFSSRAVVSQPRLCEKVWMEVIADSPINGLRRAHEPEPMNLCFATQLMLGISGAKYSVNVGPLCSGGSAVRFLSRAQLQGSVTGHCLAAANRKRHSEAVWVQAHVRIRSYEVGAMNRFLGSHSATSCRVLSRHVLYSCLPQTHL